jgi:DNA-binding transcriptional LysR family regulator
LADKVCGISPAFELTIDGRAMQNLIWKHLFPKVRQPGVSQVNIEDIKLREINVFLELLRSNSVRQLARSRNSHPGQISKVISSLEQKLGFKIIERSPLGVQITAKARDILPLFNEIQKNQENFESNFKTQERPILGFGTTSFFSTHLMPELFSKFEKKYPQYVLRLLDLPPDLFMTVALRSGFQICLHTRKLDWPQTWVSEEIGHIRWALCCRKDHPVQKNATLKTVVKYPYVFPIYWTNNGVTYGSDNFPVTIDKRMRGYETTTATSAVQIISLTDHLGFVPELVARPLINSGKLVELDLTALKPVQQPVYLSVKNDQIKQPMYTWLRRTCSESLQERK